MTDFDPRQEAQSWALETVHDLTEARHYVDDRIAYRDYADDFARQVGHEALFLLGRIKSLTGHDILEALAEAEGHEPDYTWLRKQRGGLVAAGSSPSDVDGMAVADFARAIQPVGKSRLDSVSDEAADTYRALERLCSRDNERRFFSRADVAREASVSESTAKRHINDELKPKGLVSMGPNGRGFRVTE